MILANMFVYTGCAVCNFRNYIDFEQAIGLCMISGFFVDDVNAILGEVVNGQSARGRRNRHWRRKPGCPWRGERNVSDNEDDNDDDCNGPDASDGADSPDRFDGSEHPDDSTGPEESEDADDSDDADDADDTEDPDDSEGPDDSNDADQSDDSEEPDPSHFTCPMYLNHFDEIEHDGMASNLRSIIRQGCDLEYRLPLARMVPIPRVALTVIQGHRYERMEPLLDLVRQATDDYRRVKEQESDISELQATLSGVRDTSDGASEEDALQDGEVEGNGVGGEPDEEVEDDVEEEEEEEGIQQPQRKRKRAGRTIAPSRGWTRDADGRLRSQQSVPSRGWTRDAQGRLRSRR